MKFPSMIRTRTVISTVLMKLSVAYLTVFPSCVLQSEKSVCEAELDRAGVGCEGLVALSAVLGDTQSLTPEQEGAYNAALLLCLSYFVEKAKCDGKSSTKPDFLF